MTDFNYSSTNLTDDMLKAGVPNVGKYWSDKIEKDLLEKLVAIPKHSQLYLVAVPPAYEQLKMHVEPLDYPDKPYRFMIPFDYAPMRLGGIPIVKSYWLGYDPGVEVKPDPVVWREEPVVEAVPVWQYWVAAVVFAVILSMLGNTL
jgi:hypothetical protein